MAKTYQLFQIKLSSSGFINYAYLIMDKATKEAAIVDPAWELSKITDLLRETGAKLTTILLTHSHNDHVNLVRPLAEKYGCQVYMSKKEIEYYRFSSPNLNAVNDQDVIQLGHTPITCIFTPGHTAGGICYQLSHSLFTGDTIFAEGCGMCDTEGGSPEEMYESIQRIKAHVNPDTCVYPGHSYGKEPGAPLRHLIANNIYFQFSRKDSFIRFRMRKNQKNLLRFQ
ncbi:MAG TPA: MBL fold metallo-hydrolase [Bacilli bacterium]